VSGSVGEYAKMGCEHARARLEWKREERFRALQERVARRRERNKLTGWIKGRGRLKIFNVVDQPL
jgi:hypothetical protein